MKFEYKLTLESDNEDLVKAWETWIREGIQDVFIERGAIYMVLADNIRVTQNTKFDKEISK